MVVITAIGIVTEFLATLQEMGYIGPVTIKPSRSAFPSRRREIVVKQTAEALAKVWPTDTPSAAAQPELAATAD